ncbi:MFS general substrate transporter [Sistotremastrum niveocremeum HHB9708]|uniref:MFS general substrate transporter n=1 Tax=Sistotremastrum niveocremeum HHB9708 TaxID=1314777 RepID=A0A164Q2B8_9AGAM|nr:MFS general substrate transporter [Sistotremastrum niveocremeum HHB9708]
MTAVNASERTPLLIDSNSESTVSTNDVDSELNVQPQEEREPTPLPKVQLTCLLFILICEPISSMFLFPFINQLIFEYGISGGDQKRTGYYAGLVASSFFMAETASVFFWGRLSDRVGRRPVISFGLAAVAVATVAFGFSRSLTTLMLSRAMAGGLSGNNSILKGMMAEITDESNQARAFSFTPVMFALASTVAPIIGGKLAHPVERFPEIFGNSELFKAYPYLLPCLIVALFPLMGNIINIFFLKEASGIKSPLSLPKFSTTPTSPSSQSLSSSDSERTLTPESKPKPPSISSMLTPRVRAAILNYSTIALVGNMQNFIQPLFMSTPTRYGGLGLSPSQIGSFLGALGIYNGIAQGLLFPPVHRKLGTTNLFRISLGSYILLFCFWPIISHLAKQTDEVSGTLIRLQIAQLSLLPLGRMAFSCSNIFLTSAAPSRHSMGGTVGLGQTFAAVSRSVGPSLAATLFAVSIEKNVLGGDLVYVILICIVLVSLVGTVTLPRVVKRASEE